MKQKGFDIGLFQNILLSPMKKKLRAYIEFLSVSRDEDIGRMLALGIIARKMMIDNSRSLAYLLDGTKAFQFDRGSRQISEALSDLRAMASRLEIEAKTDQFVPILMGGFAVWKMTIHCLMGKQDETLDTEGYVLGRKIWKELERGMPYVKPALSELYKGDINVNQWHYDNYNYMPEMFKP